VDRFKLKSADPEQSVRRFASELDLGEAVKAKAREIIEVSQEEGIPSGKSADGFAAAALTAAVCLCDDKRTDGDRRCSKRHGVTIRNRYQEQIDAIGGR
jgi:transcription initiation factor TFIIB